MNMKFHCTYLPPFECTYSECVGWVWASLVPRPFHRRVWEPD